MANEPIGALPLQTLSDNNVPPKRRVKNASDAATIVHSIIFANRARAFKNSKIKGMLDGNPPWAKSELKRLGQSYRTNINFREGKASLSAALVPYYDLFSSAQFYADVRLYLGNPDEQENKSSIVTEEFDCLLKEYKGFVFQMNAMLHDFVAFGKGYLIWPDKWGWHFKHAAFSKVFTPDSTESSMDEVELIVIREKYPLHRLWNKIRNKDTASSVGWDVEATAEAIRKAMPETRSSTTSDVLSYDYIQQRMKDNDLVESYSGGKQPTVQAVHLLVKEFDGTITHMIVLEPGGVGAGSEAPPVKFIFEKENQFDNMRQFMAAFFLETLEGSWNGATGIGDELYAPMEVKNRLLCKTLDNAFLASGVTLQANDAAAYQKAAQTPFVQGGNLNILPPGFSVQAGTIFANSQPLYDANQIIDQLVSTNTGIYRAKVEKPKGNPRTLGEVELQMQNATTLSNSGVGRFYQQLDAPYEEIYRRVTNMPLVGKDPETDSVRRFRERCQKRGVSMEELKSVKSVRAMRTIGNGSQFQRKQSLENFTPFVQMLPESGRQNWMNMVIAAELGQSVVDVLNPPMQKQLLPNDQQAYAVIENTMMKDGNMPVWTPTQNNVIHATEHLKAMSGAISSLEQGGDPMAALAFLEIAGPHSQVHIGKLANDPMRKMEFKTLSDQWKQMAQFTEHLAQMVQQHQQEQQQMQQEQMQAQRQAEAIRSGVDPETQIKAAQAETDMQIKRAKAAQSLQIKQLSAQQKLEAQRQQLTIKDLTTAQQLSHAHADLEMRKKESQAKLQTTNA